MTEDGQLEALIRSAARFSEKMIVLTAHEKGETTTAAATRIGPPLIFERLWQETGCKGRIEELLEERKFGFNVERAVFLTVLHRLMRPGSDRQCDRWQEDYRIEGAEEISLHHYYRAMAWLGEELDEDTSRMAKTPFSPRCHQGPHRRRAVCSAAGSVHIVGTGLLRHHFDLLRRRRRRDPWRTRLQQGPSARLEADGGRRGPGQRRTTGVLRTVAGQYGGRQIAGSRSWTGCANDSPYSRSASWPTGA